MNAVSKSESGILVESFEDSILVKDSCFIESTLKIKGLFSLAVSSKLTSSIFRRSSSWVIESIVTSSISFNNSLPEDVVLPPLLIFLLVKFVHNLQQSSILHILCIWIIIKRASVSSSKFQNLFNFEISSHEIFEGWWASNALMVESALSLKGRTSSPAINQVSSPPTTRKFSSKILIKNLFFIVAAAMIAI